MLIKRFSHCAPRLAFLTVLGLGSMAGSALAANQAGSPVSSRRILKSVDETNLVRLVGSTHPLAVAASDKGPVPDTLPMEHMFLQLRRSAGQEQALQIGISRPD